MAAGVAPEPGNGPGSILGDETLPVLDLRQQPAIGSFVAAHWRRYQLAGLSLPGANLERLFVESSNLTDADLADCRLVRAHLVDSLLVGAHLAGADLTQAVLVNVDLRGTDLTEVRMSGSVLVYCDLRGARLDRADLRQTVWSHTDLRGVDLSASLLDGARGDFFWDDATRWPASVDPQR